MEIIIPVLHYSIQIAEHLLKRVDDDSKFRIYNQLLVTITTLYDFIQNITDPSTKLKQYKKYRNALSVLLDQTADATKEIPINTFTKIDSNAKIAEKLCEILGHSTSTRAQILSSRILKNLTTDFFFDVKIEKQVGAGEEKPVETKTYQLNKHLYKRLETLPTLETFETLRVQTVLEFAMTRELLNENEIFGYLLAWSILLHMYKVREEDYKQAIFAYLKETRSYIPFLNMLMSYLLCSPPLGDEELTDLVAPHLVDSDFLMSDIDPRFVNDLFITRFSATLMFQTITSLPSLVRLWFTQCSDRRISGLIEQFVTKKISPLVIDQEFDRISKNSAELPDQVQIKVVKQFRQVSATYTQDEVALDVQLTLPESYPLKQMQVTSSKRLGVSETQWRKWIMKMTTVSIVAPQMTHIL